MVQFTSNSIVLFGFEIFYYGIILMGGTLAGIALASREAKRKQMSVHFLYDAVPWILVGGIVGARLWHIFTPPPSMVAQGITTKYYLTHPLDALNLRAGGLGIFGAVLGGLLTFYWYARRKGQSMIAWLDVFAPAIPLGQAIGRWGNFVNQELYGAPTDLPWGIYIEPENRLPEYSQIAHYHPIFLYESLWNLVSVFMLLWIAQKYAEWLKVGDVFLMYMVSYPVIRILLDYIRLDASEVGGINANQAVMAVIAVGALLALYLRHRKDERGMEETDLLN